MIAVRHGNLVRGKGGGSFQNLRNAEGAQIFHGRSWDVRQNGIGTVQLIISITDNMMAINT